ncbi:hypothetical protein ACFL3Q_11595 [Planctomycetota bacterium]
MKGEYTKAFIGFILGLSVIVFLGAAQEIKKYEAKVSGDISTSTINYQSTFSGIAPDGVCYLAITNTKDGYTNVFKITEALNDSFNENAFKKGQQGRVILHPQQQ